MEIELRSKTITLTSQELLEQYPELAMMITSSKPKRKRSYRKRKKKEKIGRLIQDIIDSIDM